MAVRSETVVLHGFKEFLKANAQAEPNSRKAIRETFRDVGDVVRREASSRFGPISSRSAAGFKTRVRQRGIAVEQSIRKTSGAHPEYGSLQMRRALLPALQSKEDELYRELERALDRVCDHFERVPWTTS